MRKKVLFLFLLIFYISIVVVFSSNNFQGDQSRYIQFAKNLTAGYYSPPDQVNLPNGPGYPIILVPFVAANIPWIIARLLNAIFLFLAVYYFYLTLKIHMQENYAFYFSLIFGLYPPFLRYLTWLLTEPLVVFLVCGFIFHLTMYQEIHIKGRKSRLHLFAAAFYLAYFMLTKVFFAYVAAIVLLCVGLFYVFKKVSSAKKTVGVYSLAFLFCLPYLIYTFSLTGKIFYWSTYGGSSLYWMSSPYSEEKGDWLGNKLNQLEEHAKKYGSKELIQNHGQLFESLKELDNIKANEKLKEKAIRNIINHPVKFTKNWFANVGRLIWDFPYSYTQQKLSTFFYLFPNMFIVVFALLCLFPTLYCNEKISGSILYLLFFALVSFLASTVLSAYPRQLIPIVPFIVLWIFYVLTRLVTIRICKMELFQ